MVKKKGKKKPTNPDFPKRHKTKKKIKECDLYYSQVITPLQRRLRADQLARNLSGIEEVWGKLQLALAHHRLLIARASYVDRP